MKKSDDFKARASRNYYENITLMNDWFMTKFFQDRKLETQEILRIILDKPDLVVKKVETQRPVQGFEKSLRLDVYAIDSKKNIHDIEIQRRNEGASPERARFHSSMLDADSLKKNEHYKSLPETHIIFITENDVLKGDKQIYHINRTIDELGNKEFGDGAHIIYVNASKPDTETELGKLLQDFTNPDPNTMNNKILRDRMYELKEKEEETMLLYEEYIQKVEMEAEKRAEKKAEKKTECRMISNLLKKNYTPETIEKLLEVPMPLIKEVQAKMEAKKT